MESSLFASARHVSDNVPRKELQWTNMLHKCFCTTGAQLSPEPGLLPVLVANLDTPRSVAFFSGSSVISFNQNVWGQVWHFYNFTAEMMSVTMNVDVVGRVRPPIRGEGPQSLHTDGQHKLAGRPQGNYFT